MGIKAACSLHHQRGRMTMNAGRRWKKKSLADWRQRREGFCHARRFSGMQSQLRAAAESVDLIEDESAFFAAQEQELSPDLIPVTVVTGFLGSGKTTLVNKILSEDHGKKIAVIINEFGEEDIDGDLVSSATNISEDIMLLNNGCLCCTVRDDLIKMIGQLVKTNEAGEKVFDHLVIETTGLADPRPIIQTFLSDDSLYEKVNLDGLICIVDAMFIDKHLEKNDDSVHYVNEAKEQILYADRILINKTDLVPQEEELKRLQGRIAKLNPTAEQIRTSHARVDADWALDVGGFDLGNVVSSLEETETETHHHHHHHDDEHDDEHHDEHHDEHEGHHRHRYLHDHHHDHHHDDEVGSVSLKLPGELDLEKVNLWMETLLTLRQDDIYRMKGVLSVKGWDRRFVFQGIHQIFSGGPEREWESDEQRVSRLVFIGKYLDQKDMMESFQECLAK